MKLHKLTATEAVAQLTSGKITGNQLFKHQKARIKGIDQAYNAFIHVVDQPIDIHSDSLLKGLPISVKDQIHVANMPCTSGYKDLKDFIPTEDAPVISKLKKAGAQIIGKTNLPPMAMDFQTNNSLHGLTRNPWHTDFTTGGSSGGDAAAVAAGLAFIGLGADLAGSLRIPASFCGISSLMPSDERLSTEGSMTLVERANIQVDYLPRIGPMARQVEDLELAWQALTDERPISKSDAKLALLPHHPKLPIQTGISDVLTSLSTALNRSSTVDLSEDQPAEFSWEEAWQAYGIIQGYQFGAMIPFWQRALGRLMSRSAMKRSPNFIKPIQDGYRRRQTEYNHALDVRERLSNSLEVFFEQYDAWIVPVTLVPAFKHVEPSFEQGFVRDYTHTFNINGEEINYFEALTRLTIPFNLTGHPVVTIPAGTDPNSGLPIGVQLVGKRNSEVELLAIAKLVQNKIGFEPLDLDKV